MMEGGDALFVQNSFKNKTLPLEVARWFTACCMVGLEDLHEDHNILHRDIKEEVRHDMILSYLFVCQQ